MAHILQGYERLILDTLISNSEPNDVALLVHDCIVYYTPKSRAELSRIVKEKTGFVVNFLLMFIILINIITKSK